MAAKTKKTTKKKTASRKKTAVSKRKSAAKKKPVAKKKSAKGKPADNGASARRKAVSVISHINQTSRAGSAYDGNSAIKLYLNEIAKTPLLTVQEEIELAARIKKGDEEAEQHMIKANLRLVVKIARDYDNLGLPLLDLIDEGNMGLMKAVTRFDPAKGGKLSTYGSWWIKQSIKRALANQSKTIRLPVHLVDKISKMRRVAMHMQEELGREPTDEELAEEMHMTAARVVQLRTAAIRPASLDAPVGDTADSDTLSDLVEDGHAHNPYEELEEKTVNNMLRQLLDTLSHREAEILKFRFGLDGGDVRTLEEVGAEFGVTRDRVRQVQNIALGRMRRMIEKVEKYEHH